MEARLTGYGSADRDLAMEQILQRLRADSLHQSGLNC